ncbi:hypothetical protein BASA50_000188 [Batrachochytrium salamandrivorans]|uniref:Uncharacterized protein n=1 Tax=Batrachochytrium salamandrivorans TaxID=1357716 RepID=A0ABQ8EUE8_9FUNG|nr:hypothetical protein BASA50_000188 [Batrachochytrium salamandrivorans]KAH6595633.1 hypothetical protein BASA61_003732 [Batrachochytrium salamandrivorans]KAH9251687.1 hypothetical protein BASA81_010455 [Batrachochytrium salamandrivorans]KAH9266906.1 hypothetical protein BASA83_010259 [Batrachochytrium salamandrivorans]
MLSAQSSSPYTTGTTTKQVTPVSETTTTPSADTTDLPLMQEKSMDTAALYDHLPSDDEEDDGEFIPLDESHDAEDEEETAANDNVDLDGDVDLDEEDDEEDEHLHADIPAEEITDLVMTSIPMQPSLLRYGKNLDGPARDSILTYTYKSDDEEDDDDYICSDDDVTNEEDDDNEDNELEDEMEPLTIQEAQDNISHFELATSRGAELLHNSAKVLRHGKEIMLPGDVDSLSTKIETLMQTTTSGNEESGIDNMVM